MLFRTLDMYLTRAIQPRTTPHLSTFIETLNVRRSILTGRYLNAPGYESNIVVLLRKILADADIPALLKKTTDFDCYFDTLIYTTPSLNSIFDAVTTGLSFYDMLIRRSSVHTEEFLIPVQCLDVIASLPFDQGWDAWRNVKPIRLIDIDSLEITSNTYQDQIVYTKLHPTRAVFTIDVVALVLQYVNFLRYNETSMNQPEYFHHYVLVNLLKDLDDIWLLNVYTTMFSLPSWSVKNASVDFLKKKVTGDGFYGYPGTELYIALEELVDMTNACRRGVLYPSVLIASLPLTGSHFPESLRYLLSTTYVENMRQDYWVEYLRDRRWLMLLYTVYQLQPNYVGLKNLCISLGRDIPLLCNSRFWTHARSPNIRRFIEQDVTDFLKKLVS